MNLGSSRKATTWSATVSALATSLSMVEHVAVVVAIAHMVLEAVIVHMVLEAAIAHMEPEVVIAHMVQEVALVRTVERFDLPAVLVGVVQIFGRRVMILMAVENLPSSCYDHRGTLVIFDG